MTSLADLGLLSLSFLVPLLIVGLSMHAYIGYLERKGSVVDDVHKKPATKVAFPAGPLLLTGLLGGEVAAYLLSGSLVPVAVAGAAAVAFAVGLADDFYVLDARLKPLLLTLSSTPLLIGVMIQSNLFEPSLTFPFLGATSEHFTIYALLVIVAFPVVANAFNMMDSFNGEISGFTLLTSLALFLGVLLRVYYSTGFSSARLASVLPLVAVSAAFLVFNRFPSKIFDGDSGALMFGAIFAALAITGGVEIAAMVAIVPAILNSFYILSSVRGLVERRKIAARPTYLGEDGRLYASPDKSSPTTLVRMLLLDGPLTEQGLVRAVLALTVVACFFSVLTSLMTWVL